MKALALRKSAAALGVAIALLTNSSCYAKAPPRPPEIASREPKTSSIVGKWQNSTCKLSNTEQTCSDETKKKAITLDVLTLDKNVAAAVKANNHGMLVSAEYTVILSSKYAIISLGPESLFSGEENFGLPLRFVNSYSIKLDKVSKEGITKVELTGADLNLSTGAGKTWRIDLSHPYDGWYIY